MAELLSLTSLPPDIIRKIFKCQGTVFGNLRLISQQWNVLACEHLRYLKNRYSIKSLCWSTSYNNIRRNYNSIVNIHITPKKSVVLLRDNSYELNSLPNSINANDTKIFEIKFRYAKSEKRFKFAQILSNSLYIEKLELSFKHPPIQKDIEETNPDIAKQMFNKTTCPLSSRQTTFHRQNFFRKLATNGIVEFNEFYTKAAALVCSIEIGLVENIRWNMESTRAEWEELKSDYEEILDVNCQLKINDLKDQCFAPTKLDARIYITPRVPIPTRSVNDFLRDIQLN